MWLACGSARVVMPSAPGDSEASRDTSPAKLISYRLQAGHRANPSHATEETTMHQYLARAIQDDARRAGERDRLHLEAQRAREPRRPRAGPAAPVRRLARLLFRRATAKHSTPRRQAAPRRL